MPKTLLAALSLLLVPVPGRAEVAVGGKGGTLGVGAELTVGLAGPFAARFGVSGFDYSDRRVASEVEYDGEARLRTASVLLDWHPGRGGFRLTGGAIYNATEVEGSSLPPASGRYEIGGVEVPAEILGTLDGELSFDPVVPYAGLGWGNALTSGGRLGVSLDLGVIFQGEPEAKLTPVIPADSPLLTIPGARELLDIALAREEREVEEDLADYDFYPVASIGLFYRF